MSELFAGLTIWTSATQGHYSQLDRLALTLEEMGAPVENWNHYLGLSDPEILALHYDARFSARPIQMPPVGPFRQWLFLGGRGSGKTWAGAQAVVSECMADPETRVLVCGPSFSEIVKNQIEGPSGILTLCPPWFQPKYQKAKRKLLFPNGAQVFWLPAQKPDKLRGYETSMIWADELAGWPANVAVEVWSQLKEVNRAKPTKSMKARGLSPRILITTTPKPTPLFRTILEQATALGDQFVLARSSSFENASNLDSQTLAEYRRFSQTERGRQEYLGEILSETNASLFGKVDWNATRLDATTRPERYDRIVVGIDPAVGETNKSDTTGIIVVGMKRQDDGFTHAYVLQDASIRDPSPAGWSTRAVEVYRAWAPFTDRICCLAERNAGGNLLKHTLKTVDRDVRVQTVWARGADKATRAAPVAMMAEGGLVHMAGEFEHLERQLARFDGRHSGRSNDDRADGFVWPIYFYLAMKGKNRSALLGKDSDGEGGDGDEAED